VGPPARLGQRSASIPPPDSAVVATYDTTRGPGTTRRLILAGSRGWIENHGAFAPMPPELHASERDEFYLYSLMRFAFAGAPGVTVAEASPDSLGQQGFVVRAVRRPDVAMYVDSTGRVAHLRLRIVDTQTHATAVQDLWLGGDIAAHGIHWPREIHITMDGAPYFELRISDFDTEAQLVDPFLAGPR
jgi:hypothetical protein